MENGVKGVVKSLIAENEKHIYELVKWTIKKPSLAYKEEEKIFIFQAFTQFFSFHSMYLNDFRRFLPFFLLKQHTQFYSNFMPSKSIFTFHFFPSSSWWNSLEVFFSLLTNLNECLQIFKQVKRWRKLPRIRIQIIFSFIFFTRKNFIWKLTFLPFFNKKRAFNIDWRKRNWEKHTKLL